MGVSTEDILKTVIDEQDVPSLAVDIGGLRMKNPVVAASGTFGYGREYSKVYDLSLLGGISVSGITLHPRVGNVPPRICETRAGMLNSIGLENPGVERFIQDELPFLRQFDVAVIVNISGSTVHEYGRLAEILDDVPGISAIEVNVSCPNVKDGGITFGTDPNMVRVVTEEVCQNTSLPVIIKLSPNVGDIGLIALAAQDGGADAVSLINTLLGMAIDTKTKRPVLGNIRGGFSGPAIKPVALRMVWDVFEKVSIPIVGMGGITEPLDAIEFMLAGASAVSVGTANFLDPFACPKVIQGIEEYLQSEGYSSVSDIVGLAHK
jgi:dihydroorotate dehydrogenase (NAD+) catalytic subunit